jgi:hypothetical protein
MRQLSDISGDLVTVGKRWWGELFWMDGEGIENPLGFEVRKFATPALHRAYWELMEAGLIWLHSDVTASRVLIVEQSYEIGEDFVMVKRYPGTLIHNFYPAHTDDPVEPPEEELSLLAETVKRLQREAVSVTDKLISGLVAKRLADLDQHLVFNESEHRFYLWDLDPDQAELEAWMVASAGLK